LTWKLIFNFSIYLCTLKPKNKMEKFLSIPVTSQQYQLLSATGIVLITQASTTTVAVHYKSSTGTDVVTITHAEAPAGSEAMRDAIQDAVVSALATSWTYVAFQVDNLPFAVSGIAIA
jgi:CRISPR/Cas system-associated endonuclease Cas1